jgi:hypothetical protein
MLFFMIGVGWLVLMTSLVSICCVAASADRAAHLEELSSREDQSSRRYGVAYASRDVERELGQAAGRSTAAVARRAST